MKTLLRFELVLPCYNESKSLHKIAGRAIAAARERGLDSESFKLVIVENGSSDDSKAVLEEMKGSEFGPWVRVVDVKKNRGYGFGLQSGLFSTSAPIVGYTHADEQCDPRDAIDAFLRVEQGKSPISSIVVKGKRSGRNWKDFAVSRIFEMFAGAVVNLWVFDVNAQPKVFGRELLEDLTDAPHDFAFDLYLLYRARKRSWEIKSISVLFPPRAHGFSNWAYSFRSRIKNIRKMIAYMIDLGHREGRL